MSHCKTEETFKNLTCQCFRQDLSRSSGVKQKLMELVSETLLQGGCEEKSMTFENRIKNLSNSGPE